MSLVLRNTELLEVLGNRNHVAHRTKVVDQRVLFVLNQLIQGLLDEVASLDGRVLDGRSGASNLGVEVDNLKVLGAGNNVVNLIDKRLVLRGVRRVNKSNLNIGELRSDLLGNGKNGSNTDTTSKQEDLLVGDILLSIVDKTSSRRSQVNNIADLEVVVDVVGSNTTGDALDGDSQVVVMADVRDGVLSTDGTLKLGKAVSSVSLMPKYWPGLADLWILCPSLGVRIKETTSGVSLIF